MIHVEPRRRHDRAPPRYGGTVACVVGDDCFVVWDDAHAFPTPAHTLRVALPAGARLEPLRGPTEAAARALATYLAAAAGA